VNETIQTMLNRRSVRAYQDRAVPQDVRQIILQATLRAPTAGNLMLYSIVEVTSQALKDRLAETCDNQPFIASAPWVLLFLADYQRWQDYFTFCGVEDFAQHEGLPLRRPQEGDLMLACDDALIAAQTAVLAAESLGLGSCYIGDIMENYEIHRELFKLPPLVFPACLVCFGYPTPQQAQRPQPERFEQRFIVYENEYKRLNGDEFKSMFGRQQARQFKDKRDIKGAVNPGQLTYRAKFAADFSLEMNRSVREMLKNWQEKAD
jgi:FMN reductase (NADPH)/FMN reductase [NAD(P)H]